MARKTLTILQMNDTHGYYDHHTEMIIGENNGVYRQAGRYSHIATIVKDVRKAHPDSVLLFDNGGAFHGTYPVIATKGEV